MPGGDRRAKAPNGYIVSGTWPHALMEPVKMAQIVQAIARALGEAMEQGGWSANALAKEAGVNRQVIANVLAGSVWLDVYTVGALEDTLGVILWPYHLDWPQQGQPKDGGRAVGPVGDKRGQEAGAAGAADGEETAPRVRASRAGERDSHERSTL